MPHYSHAQRPEKLFYNCRLIADQIIEKWMNSEEHYPVLVYQGMSGVASATALSYMLVEAAKEYRTATEFAPNFRFGMLYVRKLEEISHGEKVEYDNVFIGDQETHKKPVFIFVDDFISSGYTFARCQRGATTLYREATHKGLWWVAKTNHKNLCQAQDSPTLEEFIYTPIM